MRRVIELVALEKVDHAAIEALLDRAFGPDRHGRTAYRLREGARAIPGPSLAAIEDGKLVGTIQYWPVAFTRDEGGMGCGIVPLTLLGPVAVEPGRQRDGIGRLLMTASLEAAARAGLDGAIMLIGDPEYYGRFFVPEGAGEIGARVLLS